ncbi:PCRF domain-containing protein, partial [Dietzia sp. E1]|nr:PCRF domain-containing protein [Dietzia sp. E1]
MTQGAGRSPSSIDDVLSEYGGLEAQLSDPTLHEDAAAARRVGKRFAELTPIVQCHRALVSTRDDAAAARELAGDDSSFAE